MTYDCADFEALDPGERCWDVYGYHHIGREDESLAELALIFDTRLIDQDEYGDIVRKHLLSCLVGFNPRFTHWGVYESSKHTDDELRAAFNANVWTKLSFGYGSCEDLFVIVIDVTCEGGAVAAIDQRLEAYAPYIGYADISWPNALRTILNAVLIPSWLLERAHASDATHWIHSVPH